jgi:hypothetical protein
MCIVNPPKASIRIRRRISGGISRNRGLFSVAVGEGGVAVNGLGRGSGRVGKGGIGGSFGVSGSIFLRSHLSRLGITYNRHRLDVICKCEERRLFPPRLEGRGFKQPVRARVIVKASDVNFSIIGFDSYWRRWCGGLSYP